MNLQLCSEPVHLVSYVYSLQKGGCGVLCITLYTKYIRVCGCMCECTSVCVCVPISGIFTLSGVVAAVSWGLMLTVRADTGCFGLSQLLPCQNKIGRASCRERV